jgi:hypothetical protein
MMESETAFSSLSRAMRICQALLYTSHMVSWLDLFSFVVGVELPAFGDARGCPSLAFILFMLDPLVKGVVSDTMEFHLADHVGHIWPLPTSENEVC